MRFLFGAIAALLFVATLPAQTGCGVNDPFNVQLGFPNTVSAFALDEPSGDGTLADFGGYLEDSGDCDRYIEIGEYYRFNTHGAVRRWEYDTSAGIQCRLQLASSGLQETYTAFLAISTTGMNTFLGNLTGDNSGCQTGNYQYVDWSTYVSITGTATGTWTSSWIWIPNDPALVGVIVYHQVVASSSEGLYTSAPIGLSIYDTIP